MMAEFNKARQPKELKRPLETVQKAPDRDDAMHLIASFIMT